MIGLKFKRASDGVEFKVKKIESRLIADKSPIKPAETFPDFMKRLQTHNIEEIFITFENEKSIDLVYSVIEASARFENFSL